MESHPIVVIIFPDIFFANFLGKFLTIFQTIFFWKNFLNNFCCAAHGFNQIKDIIHAQKMDISCGGIFLGRLRRMDALVINYKKKNFFCSFLQFFPLIFPHFFTIFHNFSLWLQRYILSQLPFWFMFKSFRFQNSDYSEKEE